MPHTRRNALAAVLARIDQLLAEAEEIALDPEGDEQDAATDFIVEFHQTRRVVEAKLRGDG
jgi:hypothetical protein